VATPFNRPLFFPEDFNAVGNGKNNDTAALQAAIDAAAAAGGEVIGKYGAIYSLSKIVLKNGLKAFRQNGSVLKSRGETNVQNYSATNPLFLQEAVVLVQGALTGGASCSDMYISVNIDMSGGDLLAVALDGAQNIQINKCNIFGIVSNPNHDQRGIRLDNSCKNISLTECVLTGPPEPKKRCHLVEVWGEATIDFGGFFNGEYSRSNNPSSNHIFSDNRFYYGSYGINLYAAEGCRLVRNRLHGQNHRSIYLANASSFNLIANNVCTQFYSSAVLLGYSASYNIVRDNTCINENNYGFNAEAAINLNTGARGNQIIRNYIKSPQNFGVYNGPDCVGTLIERNQISGAYLALIRVENDVRDNNHSGDPYARSNYADPIIGGISKSWTYRNLSGIVIRGNILGAGHSERRIAALSIAQVENDFDGTRITGINGVVIQSNRFMSLQNIAYLVHIAAASVSGLRNLIFRDNVFPSGASLVHFEDSGKADFSSSIISSGNNGVFDSRVAAARQKI